jgi:hypothetical protein
MICFYVRYVLAVDRGFWMEALAIDWTVAVIYVE